MKEIAALTHESNSSDKAVFTAQDHKFMTRAMELAQIAEQHNEIPVGAVVVYQGEIVGEGYNRSIIDNDPSAHAEMMAVRAAGKTLGNYRLIDCTLYVTLEPCPMCAGLLVHSRVKRVVFAAPDEKTGAAGTVFNLTHEPKLNHLIDVNSGLMQAECSAMLSHFFKRRRAEIKAAKQLKKQQLAQAQQQEK
ncbi:tRNA adenosine(34) deaminase TadA [Thalassotalea euphylliae]|uniref:tRNA-specific adenosine deaminase n=1 Tax=Thalassotalea euphylliae TaxID=1655234 RepID=A0A3E0TT09_9GAMM|nr:tRNA adenosine(34) deaminase TadA [Thalassotalea euphylliae]REL27811.1 tRNA adenosine(34) deaminase TadA [Thalassotalea euphylliae]